MAVVTVDTKTNGSGPGWARNYPPLLAMAVALLLAIAILPSSLNVPQPKTQTTLEFAPVPPEDDEPPPPNSGNFSSLGLGSTGSLEEGGLPGGDDLTDVSVPDPTDLDGGKGRTPLTKKCVGNPPRQTEDPLAPPCVGNFEGDNGGATYQGVTGEEIRILFYMQGFRRYTNRCRDPNQVTPDGEYFDLAQPPEEGEHCVIRTLRTWQQYFNDRYQTYGRFAHFFVYVSGAGDTAEERKADAADNYQRIKPFAVISNASSFQLDYLASMAKRGVLAFGGSDLRSAEFFRKYPGKIWAYNPTLEIKAKQFSSYICKKVAPFPVVDSGNPGENGKKRVFGLYYTSSSTRKDLQAIAQLVKQQVKDQCGVTFAAEKTFPNCCYFQDNSTPPTRARQNAADFQAAGVTTIIWPGGLETQLSKAGAAIGYRPEVIVMGDDNIEGDRNGTGQDQSFWDQAWVVTNIVAVADVRQQPCFLAYKEADPNADEVEALADGCAFYNDIRQLFTGIQVAGPKLTPGNVDKGYHAIPPKKSSSPQVPACFYEPADYTCVKDAMVEQWDPGACDDGAYVMIEGGQRYFAEIWPDGNIDAQGMGTACNAYDPGFLINPNPPSTDSL